MPQGPFQVVSLGAANNSKLDISSATVVKATNGYIVTVNVLVAGAVGAIYDSNSLVGNTAANQIAEIPAVVGTYAINFPAKTGIVVAPGAAQVVSVAFN